MEYSESIIQGPSIELSPCNQCGCKQYKTEGVLKYGFYFLEYLPFIPVGRIVKVTCQSCRAKFDDQQLPALRSIHLRQSIFKLHHYLSKFLGLIISLLLIALLLINHVNKEKRIDQLVAAPQINDFVILDYRRLTHDRRPNQNYLIAKVTDITGDVVSLAYGNYFYVRHAYAENNLAMGRTTHFDYFQKKRRDFTLTEYKTLRDLDIIVQVERPEGNMLFGNSVIEPRQLPKADALIPGSIENVKGLAYQQLTYLPDHLSIAKDFLVISAELGYKYGQINLANLYLVERSGFYSQEQALYWYQQAALQESQMAIDKYISLCKYVESCDPAAFYQTLRKHGVNLTLGSG